MTINFGWDSASRTDNIATKNCRDDQNGVWLITLIILPGMVTLDEWAVAQCPAVVYGHHLHTNFTPPAIWSSFVIWLLGPHCKAARRQVNKSRDVLGIASNYEPLVIGLCLLTGRRWGDVTGRDATCAFLIIHFLYKFSSCEYCFCVSVNVFGVGVVADQTDMAVVLPHIFNVYQHCWSHPFNATVTLHSIRQFITSTIL